MPFIKLSAIVGFQKPKAVAASPAPVEQLDDVDLEDVDYENAEPEDLQLEPEPVMNVVQPVAQTISQPVSQHPARPLGKLDGNTIRNMATRGFPRR
jgi:hypothetical protein